MANTTTTQVAHGQNNFYVRTMLRRAVPYFVHTKFGQVKDIPKGNTNVIKFRRYGNLTAATTALTEGVTPDGSQLSVTDVSATVAQYGDFITLTDFLIMTTLDPVTTETAELLGDQYGDTVDQVARDILAAGTNVIYPSNYTLRNQITSSDKITTTLIKIAVRTLKNSNAKKLTSMVNASTGYNTSPLPASFVGIVHPNTTYDLKELTGFTKVENYANQRDAMENEVGKYDEVRFVESTNAKVFTGLGDSGGDVYGTIIFARDAYGVSRISGEAVRMISKALGSGGTNDPLDQRATAGWKATFVTKILNNSWMIRIEHAVSA